MESLRWLSRRGSSSDPFADTRERLVDQCNSFLSGPESPHCDRQASVAASTSASSDALGHLRSLRALSSYLEMVLERQRLSSSVCAPLRKLTLGPLLETLPDQLAPLFHDHSINRLQDNVLWFQVIVNIAELLDAQGCSGDVNRDGGRDSKAERHESVDFPSPTHSPDYRVAAHRRFSLDFSLLLLGAVGAAILSTFDLVQSPSRFILGPIGVRLTPYLPLMDTAASTATLVAAVAITSLSLTTYHYLHRTENHLNLRILLSVLLGQVLGWLCGMDQMSVILRILPWCIFAAFLVGKV